MKNQISKNFHVPLNSLAYPVSKRQSPHWQRAIWGGADWGYRELGPGTPPSVRGSIYKKKVLRDPGPNTHTAATICKEVLTPPPPPKRGYPSAGGYGGQNPKNHSGIIFGPKMMILQGLDVRNHTLGYATRTTPKKGGIRRSRLRLI